MSWRFAQFSDAHLGCRLPSLSDEAGMSMRLATREAILSGLKVAQDKGCRAVLIPGDLYDQKAPDASGQLNWFYEQVAEFPKMQFFIAPGEADAFTPSSPYSLLRPPANVYLFANYDWETVEIDGVTITSRSLRSGEGAIQLDWNSVPAPHSDRLSLLMLHGTLQGAVDGKERRMPFMQVSQKDLLSAQYTYTALGHMHARIELQRRSGHTLAAYAGPPQCLGFDELGPGGVFIGSLSPEGAELAFHNTGRFKWLRRTIELPPLYTDAYKEKLQAAYNLLAEGLSEGDIVNLKIGGELAVGRRSELERLLGQVGQHVFQCEADTSTLRLFNGPDQTELPADSLLADFLRRIGAETGTGGNSAEVLDLARRLGWRLFTGQGLPAEISQ